MGGIGPLGGGLRQHLFVTTIDGVPWLVGDLHERNIMRDVNGTPTIIDALVGAISLTARRELDWLDASVRGGAAVPGERHEAATVG